MAWTPYIAVIDDIMPPFGMAFGVGIVLVCEINITSCEDFTVGVDNCDLFETSLLYDDFTARVS